MNECVNECMNELECVICRAGIGLLLKDVDESVANMHVGDKYHPVFGGDLAFRQKGRSSGDDDELMVMMAIC